MQPYRLQAARLLCPWDSLSKNIAVPSSRGSSQPRDQTHISYVYLHWQVGLYHLYHLGSPGESVSLNNKEDTNDCISLYKR